MLRCTYRDDTKAQLIVSDSEHVQKTPVAADTLSLKVIFHTALQVGHSGLVKYDQHSVFQPVWDCGKGIHRI